jgi:group I intron endonuclease
MQVIPMNKNALNSKMELTNSGIYKILSPSGKVYVGQSINLSKREKDYFKYNKTGFQKRLKASVEKYGWEKHIFEILEFCSLEILNERERYWQEFYQVLGENGLNCKYTKTDSKSGNLSEKTKHSIGNALKGKKRTEEQKARFSKSKKGLKQTKETVNKRILKIKELYKNESYRKQFGKQFRKIIMQYDLENNFIKEWESLREASRDLKISIGRISECASEKRKSAGGFIWKYKT